MPLKGWVKHVRFFWKKRPQSFIYRMKPWGLLSVCTGYRTILRRNRIRATPHNGARRFDQYFDQSKSVENGGILDVFPIFHTARLGQMVCWSPQLPPKRCCLSWVASKATYCRWLGINGKFWTSEICPMELRHIHIFQRERNPDILRVNLAPGKQDNRLLYPISGSCQITA